MLFRSRRKEECARGKYNPANKNKNIPEILTRYPDQKCGQGIQRCRLNIVYKDRHSESPEVGPQEIEVIKDLVLEGLDPGHKDPVTDGGVLKGATHGCADHCEKVPVEDQCQTDGQQQSYSDIYGEPVQCVL